MLFGCIHSDDEIHHKQAINSLQHNQETIIQHNITITILGKNLDKKNTQINYSVLKQFVKLTITTLENYLMFQSILSEINISFRA